MSLPTTLILIRLNVLEDFLEKFGGCMLLVSHDRYFMDHLVDQLFVFEGDGKIRLFNGNYSDYRNWVDEQDQVKEQSPAVREVVTPSSQKNTISYKEKQEHARLQEEIASLELKRTELSELLNTSSSNAALLIEIGKDIEKVTTEIESKTSRWFELSSLIESE
jgi:ATP-binding cassette subfamily F protein uup